MGKRLWCGGLIFLAPFLVGTVSEARDRSLSSVRTQYFEVVGPDGVSTDFTAALCRRLEDVTRPWLSLPVNFSNRIFVRLEPAESYRYETPFHTTAEVAGNVTVTVRWDESTRLTDLERGVARALLTRIAAWNNVSGDQVDVPLWLEAALQRVVRAAGNPSYVDGMARQMRERGPVPLKEILEREGGELYEDFFAVNAYWLLGHLQQHSRRSDRLHNFVIRLLSGNPPETSLMATFASEFQESENAQLWWSVGVHDRIRRRAMTQSHFYDSRQLVRTMSRFTFRKDEGETLLGLEDLWDHRNEPVLRNELVQRMERINFEMGSIHPFHFNAILSLGQVMGSLYDGSESEFMNLVSTFRADYHEAEQLFRETEEALDSLEEAIGVR